jgi:flagellar basal body L-ring protein FlgH
MKTRIETRRTIVLAGALAFALATTSGCGAREETVPPQQPAAAEAAAVETSEAERARELEAKAEGFKDRFAEIQESDMSPDQKAQAVGALVDEQQRAIQESEAGSEPKDDGND